MVILRSEIQNTGAVAMSPQFRRGSYLDPLSKVAIMELTVEPNPDMMLSQQDSAVASIEMATRYSRPCCSLIASHGGVSALLRFMRNCNRSKPHEPLLHGALAILANICRWVWGSASVGQTCVCWHVTHEVGCVQMCMLLFLPLLQRPNLGWCQSRS